MSLGLGSPAPRAQGKGAGAGVVGGHSSTLGTFGNFVVPRVGLSWSMGLVHTGLSQASSPVSPCPRLVCPCPEAPCHQRCLVLCPHPTPTARHATEGSWSDWQRRQILISSGCPQRKGLQRAAASLLINVLLASREAGGCGRPRPAHLLREPGAHLLDCESRP